MWVKEEGLVVNVIRGERARLLVKKEGRIVWFGRLAREGSMGGGRWVGVWVEEYLGLSVEREGKGFGAGKGEGAWAEGEGRRNGVLAEGEGMGCGQREKEWGVGGGRVEEV